MKDKECRICSCEPCFWCDNIEYSRFDSTICLAEGGYSQLRAGKDEDNKVVMFGCGNDYTEAYYPKYCPECGQKLHD